MKNVDFVYWKFFGWLCFAISWLCEWQFVSPSQH